MNVMFHNSLNNLKNDSFDFQRSKPHENERILSFMKPYYDNTSMSYSDYKQFIRLHARYFENRSSVVSGIIMSMRYSDQEGLVIPHILFVKDVKGNLQLPGGRIDPKECGRHKNIQYDESPKHAIIGEITEEVQAQFLDVNLGSSQKEIMYVGSGEQQIKTYINIYTFAVNSDLVVNGDFVSDYETKGAYWIPVSQIIDLKLIPQRYKITIFKQMKNLFAKKINNNRKERIEKITNENIVNICSEIYKTLPLSTIISNSLLQQNNERTNNIQLTQNQEIFIPQICVM